MQTTGTHRLARSLSRAALGRRSRGRVSRTWSSRTWSSRTWSSHALALAFVLVGCAPSVANRSAPREDTEAGSETASPAEAELRASPDVPSAPTSDEVAHVDPPRDSDDTAAARHDAAIDAFCGCLTGTQARFELTSVVTGRLPREVPEASGMVTSRFDDAVLWTHNDSGHAPTLFAVHEDGRLLAQVELPVPNRDFEDLAAGPCDDGDRARSCLYVGDFGDNELRETSVRVHRVREPDPRSAPASVARVETQELVFPDGARDTEAMVVDERGTVWLLTKRPPNGSFRIYSAPFRSGTATLTAHGEVSLAPLGMVASLSMFTAADLHPRCGLIGAYYGGALAIAAAAEGVDRSVGAELVPLPTGRGLQNEAIAFTSDGYRHAIEGEGAAIHRFRCTARD